MGSLKHEEKVQELTERLKRLKDDMREFQGCRHVDGYQVHPRLREEIARLFDEHGGIEILSQITKVAYKTIKEWRSRIKRNPQYFQDMPLHPPFYRPPATHYNGHRIAKSILEERKIVLNKLRSCTLYKSANTIDQVRQLLPVEVIEQLDTLKKTVDESVQNDTELSPQVKLHIARLVLRAGHPRPVALLLGLNQKVILSWKGLFVLADKQQALEAGN